MERITMKTFITLSLFILSACGKDGGGQSLANPFAQSGQSGSPIVGVTPACSIPIVGVFQNNSDGVTATIAERNGTCGLQLSCGFHGYIFDLGGNQYIMIASTIEGDTVGGCALPAQSTTSHGKSGTYFNLTFGNYAGIGWQGGFMPSEINNQWSKL